MASEIEAASYSLQLSGAQRHLLETEFFFPEEKATRPRPATNRRTSVKADTLGSQINRLRQECHLTVDELAEKIDIDVRSVRRHLKDDSVPYDRHIWAYQRLFSKLLNRQVVLRQMS
jgi:DNA-binding XRE family transcriptional regulator